MGLPAEAYAEKINPSWIKGHVVLHLDPGGVKLTPHAPDPAPPRGFSYCSKSLHIFSEGV